ncbi:NAD(P)H dehydrogenase (quinone) [Cytobacillus horneckiae]|uniref:NAD(P)H:quinone oxidoreductase n=1 Tax=Cytobacillus horneckiae TaxID=549687 RepID=A0A2N0ZBM5_9BACI|nr:NAD(P)H:quinone oxidoreductase [Cytobacillus horneckiae]MBN6885328.1 NAD(P)H:quinone oxidoreductase [Cytobacillus horneckiae]MCM3178943.1 NAD(P)H:quinone oxidoreductase [Cytobacillus horneckiae]MEC1154159.1 NAD(P)H:quinone oxidoreductase [Cytobacillus horneckiae]MED2936296.1 NAD(P)H:quinone oxidoreductase [Cytobacillus horneckiae]PKG26931.1 NAD(P)H:quinone oxidoreductase [Cytobacillus horneckiae]
MSVKLAVIYYSSTGTNYQMAQWAEQGAKEAGAEVKLLKFPETAPEAAVDSNPAWRANADATKDIPEVTLADLEWADAIVFSVPTRFGNIASQVQAFIDTAGGLWAQGKLANKVVSAMSTASNPHGGQEATILSLYTTMYHWGAIVAAPGFTDPSIFAGGGNPYGTSATQGQDGKIVEDVEAAVKHQAKRTATVAEWVKKGNQ